MKVGVITLMTALLLALPAFAGPGDPCIGAPDTDSDGHTDPCDNCLVIANAAQLDCDSDGCGNRCDGDIDQSGGVSIADFSLWALQFGFSGGCFTGDIDESGGVTIADFSLWAGLFGGAPGPSGTTSGTTACP